MPDAPAGSSSSSTESPSGGMSYRTQLVLAMTVLLLISAGAVMLVAFGSSAASARSLADSLFREASSHAVTRARNHVLGVVPLLNALATIAPDTLALSDSDRLALQLAGVLRANDGLTWLSFSNESGAFTAAYRADAGSIRLNQSRIVGGKTSLVERDILTDGSLKVHRTDPNSGYDPRTRSFYTSAKEKGRLVWLPPYVFFGQNLPGITAAAPVRDSAGRLLGVMTADFDLNALSKFVGQLSVSSNSRFFLFTDAGVLLAHPGTQVVSASTQPNEARLLNLRDVGNAVTLVYEQHLPTGALSARRSGDHFESFRFRHAGVDYLASATAFRVDEGLTWIVGALAPEDDFLGGVRRGQRIALGVAGGAVLGALGLAVLLSRRVSSPVVNLIAFMRRVSEGDLESKAALRGPHEFRQLSHNLNHMIDDLRDRMKLRHSLHLAMEVQQRLLPSAPPKVPGLDLAGHSTYCDETGGDYYDFLVIDQTNPTSVVIALGDVMGHGIAAALVMAGARAVLRDRATGTGNLAQVLDRINKLLNEDMQGTKFMTLHLSIIDASARTFRWASAGHDPAIIYDPAEGKFHEIDESGFPLGVNDDGMYSEHTFPLKPGQIITIGTDGIWEMVDDQDEQFGKDRLREIIRDSFNLSADEISKNITDSLTRFRGRRDALDDVTFVVAKVI